MLNIQEGIAQLGMRQITMLEIAPSKPATRSKYDEWTQSPEVLQVVKKEPVGQEGTIGQGRRRSGGRVLKREKGGGWSEKRPSPPEATREIPFYALGAHRKSRAFCAEFNIMHKSSAIRAHISTVVVVVRASLMIAAHECIFLHWVTFCDGAARYILHFRVTFYFKTTCLVLF